MDSPAPSPGERSPRTIALAGFDRWIAVLTALATLSVAATGSEAIGRPFSGDEIASAIVIAKPGPVAALLQIARGESTPPLWYGAAWLAHLGGAPIVWVRLLSVAAMAAAVALTAVFARMSGLGVWGAALAGVLATLGQQFVQRGGELRAYALFCLLSVVFAIVLRRAAALPDRRRCWTLSAVVALGALTHYFFLLSILAGGMWVAVDREARTRSRRLARHIAAGLAPLLLWTPVIVHQYHTARYTWIRHVSPHLVVSAAANVFVDPWVSRSVAADAYLLGPILATAGVAVLARTPTGRLCALLAGVPVVVSSVVWWLGVPVFDVRNLIGAAPFLAIAIAGCVERLGRAAVPAGVVLLVILGGTQLDARIHLHRTDFSAVSARLVGEGWRPRAPIALFGPIYGSVALAWYLPGHPRLDPGTIRLGRGAPAGSCRSLFVVAEQGRGRAWLRATVAAAIRPVAAYGSGELGARGAPILVGRVPLTAAVLASARAAGMRALGVRGSAGCVRAPG